jgi:hypothetical protein
MRLEMTNYALNLRAARVPGFLRQSPCTCLSVSAMYDDFALANPNASYEAPQRAASHCTISHRHLAIVCDIWTCMALCR